MQRFFNLVLAVAAALALVSCNSAVPAPKIDSFTAQPSTVASGSNVTLSWSVSGVQPIKLSIDNGVGDVTGKTSITVDPTATTTYTLTASDAAGSATAIAKVTVTTGAKTVRPTITGFTASPSSIATGGSATLSWTVTGTSPVGLSIDHGVGTVTGQSSVSVSPTTSTTYTLTATNAAGSTTAQTTVTVNATSGTTVTVTEQGTLPWIAYQDGVGAWQPLSGTSFTVSDASGRYGVAWVCPASSPSPPTVLVVQATVAESASVTTVCSSTTAPATQPYTVSGTVSNIPSGFTTTLVLSTSIDGLVGSHGSVASPGGSYSLAADAGTHALLAFDLDSSNNPKTMVLKRNISVSGNVSGVNVDMSSGQPFSMGTVNLAGAASGASLFTSAVFELSGGGVVGLQGGSSGSVSYPQVPAALQLSGDRYSFVGLASTSSTGQLAIKVVAGTPGSVLSLPPVVSGSAGVQVSGGTGVVSWGSLSFGTGGATTYLAGVSGSGVGWVALVTQGWLGSSSSYTFPSFTGTSGWDSAWDFPVNQSATVDLGALHGNVTSTQLLQMFENPQTLVGGSTFPAGTDVEETVRSFTGTY